MAEMREARELGVFIAHHESRCRAQRGGLRGFEAKNSVNNQPTIDFAVNASARPMTRPERRPVHEAFVSGGRCSQGIVLLPPVPDDHLASIVSPSRRPRLAACISCFRADGSGMPSSGWLAALTRHFTRTPSVPRAHAHTRECGRAGGNGIAIVSSQNASPTPPSRPTTPWNLETLDDEIQRAAGDEEDLQESEEAAPRAGSSSSRRRESPSAMSAAAGPQRRGSYSRPTSASSRPPSSASRPTSAPSRPSSSAASRPTSAASRLSAPAHPLLRSQTQAETAAGSGPSTPLPAQYNERPLATGLGKGLHGHFLSDYFSGCFTCLSLSFVDDPGDYHAFLYDLDARGHYFIPPVIPPLYDRPVAAPTPMSTRCNTPVWDLDGEKRVRFLEPEVGGGMKLGLALRFSGMLGALQLHHQAIFSIYCTVYSSIHHGKLTSMNPIDSVDIHLMTVVVVGDTPSRPPSVTSQYSQVLKNSTRFLFQPSQALTGDPGGHNPRYCNCPCHFFPSGRKSVGIQVKRTDPEPPRPRHYRLFFTPTMRGLEQVNFGTKSVSLATRAIFSQVGLAVLVVAWWVAGAAIFSSVEGAAESKTVDRMAALRTDLVLGLATELRQVLPYDLVWRTKIETYMGRLENAVLDAARAGYASRAPTWTMSGALLYSASLTTLVGPGGMTLRTGFSRIFAVLFSLVGAPLVLLLAISGAFTLREGVGKAWAWRCGRGRQSRVSDGRGQEERRAEQYGSGRGGSATSTLNLASARPHSSSNPGPSAADAGPDTPNGPGELPGSTVPGNSAKVRGMAETSRVPVLDSTLRSSTSSGLTAQDTDASSESGAITAAPTTSAGRPSEQRLGVGATDAVPRRPKQVYYPYPAPPRRSKTAPWVVYLVILLVYLLLGFAIFAPIQRWSLPSALYILSGTLLTLDHECLGERQTLGSSKIIVPYVLYMLLGIVLATSLVMSVWSSLCASLVNTGKYLAVVRPTAR
ncbi:uncharacterized protein LOC134764210 [Penaeus indicus]|uniref:uncharacterized protein LOC134764210 n=1 Tax=Penaeus indicus TaxID=29960 RepID=UPI00300D6E3C